tara:strand:+ start:451 stop:624 length:174 start_codon:yes stop_codon:yes gene_type:complete
MGKGDMPRPGAYSQEYKDNWERIFGDKAKARKKTPDHAKSKIHKDKTKYDRNKVKKK